MKSKSLLLAALATLNLGFLPAPVMKSEPVKPKKVLERVVQDNTPTPKLSLLGIESDVFVLNGPTKDYHKEFGNMYTIIRDQKPFNWGPKDEFFVQDYTTHPY